MIPLTIFRPNKKNVIDQNVEKVRVMNSVSGTKEFVQSVIEYVNRWMNLEHSSTCASPAVGPPPPFISNFAGESLLWRTGCNGRGFE
jgi:hypothetical protein